MFENTDAEPETKLENQSERDYITSELSKIFEEKQPRFDKLEKKILTDIQTIEGLKYEFCDMMKYIEAETEELELMEISLGMEEQGSDNIFTNIKEEEENSSSNSENEDVNPSNQKKFSLQEKTSPLKKPSNQPFAKGRKEDKGFDELTAKYDYSKVQTKRDDKKFDELSARYDYSRVATKRPTTLEKHYNISNSNLLKKDQDKKIPMDTGVPKRNDMRQSTSVRKLSKPIGTVTGIDKNMIFGKQNSGTGAKNETDAGNKLQDDEGNKLNSMGNSQVIRRGEKRTTLVVNPVKRDMNAMINKNSASSKNEDSVSNPKIPNLSDKIAAENLKQANIQLKLMNLLQKINDKVYNKFSSAPVGALNLSIMSGFIEPREKLSLITSCEEIYKKTGVGSVAKLALDKMTLIVNYYEDTYSIYLNDANVKTLINKTFLPTKTAEHGLSFIKKDDELNLAKNWPGEDIIEVFKFIYVLIDEELEEILPEDIIENLFNKIMPKLGYTNIRQLFLEYITSKKGINDEKYRKLLEIFSKNPNVLASHYLIKQNRSVSYMTFFLKEIFDYFSLKTSDGMLVYKLRNIQNVINKLTQKIMAENAKTMIPPVNP